MSIPSPPPTSFHYHASRPKRRVFYVIRLYLLLSNFLRLSPLRRIVLCVLSRLWNRVGRRFSAFPISGGEGGLLGRKHTLRTSNSHISFLASTPYARAKLITPTAVITRPKGNPIQRRRRVCARAHERTLARTHARAQYNK